MTESSDQLEVRESSIVPSSRWRMAAPYELIRRLSEGKLLFEGRNKRTGQRVVVQLLKGLQSEQQLRAQLQTCARLHHASTVKVIDAGLVSEPVCVGYVIRQFVRGSSLVDILKREGALSVSRALTLGSQLLECLMEAHRAGVVHGRLSLEHLLLEGLPLSSEALCAGLGCCEQVRVLGFWKASEIDASHDEQDDLLAVGRVLWAMLFGLDRSESQPVVEGGGGAHDGRLGQVFGREGTSSVRELASSAKPEEGGRRELLDFLERATRDGAFATAREMLSALQGLNWEQDGTQPSSTARVDRFVAAAPSTSASQAIQPFQTVRPPLTVPTLWLLADDPAFAEEGMKLALSQLRRSYRVHVLTAVQRKRLLGQVRAGSVCPPHGLLFGQRSVFVEEPLLVALGRCAEVTFCYLSRTEVFSPARFTQLTSFVRLDAVCLPSWPLREIITVIERCVERSNRRQRAYNQLRAELQEARERLSRLSQEASRIELLPLESSDSTRSADHKAS